MYQLKAYLKFLWKSTNQHGVHSPFVYSLVTRCIYDRKYNSAYDVIERFRKALLEDDSTIVVKDLGAGSRVFGSSERKVAEIARTAGTTGKRTRLLNRLVRYLNVQSALELGTSLGIGSTAIAAGNEVKVTTLEGCPNTAKVANEQFVSFDLKNISLKTGDFKEFLSQLPQENVYDLVYFDGNHKKQSTLEYFKTLLPYTHNDSIFIFDDIHWSKEMGEAWEEIKAHPSVKISIDTFFWGIVFFRREQEKEHFVLRA